MPDARYVAFYQELARTGYEGFVREHPFAQDIPGELANSLPHYHPKKNKSGSRRRRQYRFDLAWPDRKLAIEIDGGVWTGGRHTRGSGFQEDLYKMNLAALLGWTVLRYTPDDLFSHALSDVKHIFDGNTLDLVNGPDRKTQRVK